MNNELNDLKIVFSKIMELMNYEMNIYGYKLTLWQFFVVDVACCGMVYMIFRPFFDNE